MVTQDWQSFPAAFSAAVRHGREQPRAAVRVMLVSAVTALAAACVVSLIGGAAGLIHYDDQAVRLIAMPTANSPGGGGGLRSTAWTAVAGPSCEPQPGEVGSSSFSAYGYDTASPGYGRTGWTTVPRGGWTGDGCHGGFLALPVSGHRDAYDRTQFGLWRFDFSATFTRARCTVDTYVPTGQPVSEVGGDPAFYLYYDDDHPYGWDGPASGGYHVQQSGGRAGWVNNGSFEVHTGKVTVKLMNAGVNTTSATANAHVAAAQVRLTCQSA